jgi:hypothetical protein
MADPLMQGAPRMAHLILAVALERARECGLSDLTDGRPRLTSWCAQCPTFLQCRGQPHPKAGRDYERLPIAE